MVEEIKDINLEIGAANLFLQRAENQDELKVILAKGEMAHFHVTKQENQLEMSYKKNGKISREETDEIIVQSRKIHQFGKQCLFHWGWKTERQRIITVDGKTGIGSWKLEKQN